MKIHKTKFGSALLFLILTLTLVQGCVSKKRFISELNEKETLSEQLRNESEKAARLENEKRDIGQRLSTEREKLAQLRKQQEQNNLSTEEEVDRLKNALSQKEQRLSELEGRLSQSANRSAQLEKQLADSRKTAVEKIQDAQEILKAQDELIGSLKKEIDDGNVRISKMNDRLSVQIVSSILFPSGSDRVTGEGEAVLKKVSASLKSIQKNKIQIEGHTDNVPIGANLAQKFPSNWELSTSRATQVVRFLAQEAVRPENMLAVGMAEFAPVSSNDTPEGRQQNRRIEIVLIPK